MHDFSSCSVHSNLALTTSTSCSMAAQIAPSSSETLSNHPKYDVFLSFRGKDTRTNFTDHLYTALIQAKIITFRDDKLPRGEIIAEELVNAIRDSRISIVVFSEGYASSTWCLQELVEILDCTKAKSHTLIPVFYHVNPSDVRELTGPFGEAFVRHEEQFQANTDQIQRWKAALTKAGGLSGWDVDSVGYESNFIDKIIKDLHQKLKVLKPVRLLDVTEHLVEAGCRVEEIKTLLDLGKSEVRIVGIYGVGGIGKTTLAKVVYNQICDRFEGSSCLENIRTHSEQVNGTLVHLQEQLLSDILRTRIIERPYNEEEGIKLIEKKIGGRKILLVLDDVNDLMQQIYKMVGNFEWFAPGSRIIVTTRDEHLLTQINEVNIGKYEVPPMAPDASLQLFSWHAFGSSYPTEGYLEVSKNAVNYAGRHPLWLKLLGSYLKGRSAIEWETTLKIFQRVPCSKICENYSKTLIPA